MQQRIAIGTRLRYVGREAQRIGREVIGIYKGGADYVPGLDAGNFVVEFESGPQDWFWDHRSMAHWTYDEVMSTWEVVA